MAEYLPPTEDLPIFDSTVFKDANDGYLTYNKAKKIFLKYPTAQGDETLQAITVNGIATFENIIKSKEQLQLIDTTGPSLTTECLIAGNSTNNNRFALVLNPVAQGYNPITQANDVLLGGGDVTQLLGNQPVTLTTWAPNTCGLRITNNDVMLGCEAGVNFYPSNRISFTQTSTNLYGPTNVNNSIVMTGATGIDRQITCGYVNLSPIGGIPVATGTQLYASGVSSYWDNNVNGGIITFATNTSGGVQVLPLNLTSTYAETNLPFKINGIGNYLQFPDGTQQTTASSNKTYTIEYLTSQTITIPTNCTGVSINFCGRGGEAGFNNDSVSGTTWNSGGSGGGASSAISQGIFPLTYGTFNVTISNISGSPNILSYNGIEICRVYNGYAGISATSTSAGNGGNAQIAISVNSTVGIWATNTGSTGTNGATGIAYQNCSAVPSTSGKPSNVITSGSINDNIRGCGQRYIAAFSTSGNNICPNTTPVQPSSLILTYYIK